MVALWFHIEVFFLPLQKLMRTLGKKMLDMKKENHAPQIASNKKQIRGKKSPQLKKIAIIKKKACMV